MRDESPAASSSSSQQQIFQKNRRSLHSILVASSENEQTKQTTTTPKPISSFTMMISPRSAKFKQGIVPLTSREQAYIPKKLFGGETTGREVSSKGGFFTQRGTKGSESTEMTKDCLFGQTIKNQLQLNISSKGEGVFIHKSQGQSPSSKFSIQVKTDRRIQHSVLDSSLGRRPSHSKSTTTTSTLTRKRPHMLEQLHGVSVEEQSIVGSPQSSYMPINKARQTLGVWSPDRLNGSRSYLSPSPIRVSNLADYTAKT